MREQLTEATRQLQENMVGGEVTMVEDLLAMAEKYDQDITLLAEACRPHYASCFASVRPWLLVARGLRLQRSQRRDAVALPGYARSC